MKLYHRTFASDAILKEGFKDATGTNLTGIYHTGIWFGDSPFDENAGAWGDVVLTIEIPESEILEYEWTEEGKPYREFLIPAKIVNKYGPPVVYERD